MKTRLEHLWESVRQSLWLLPAISVSLAVALSIGMAYVDEYAAEHWAEFPFVYRSGREASLAIVSAITSSLITVAGVTFSITIVSLTLASSQFGPRLLRNFLRSFPSQITFGALMGSFMYGIVLMPSIGADWEAGVPHPSISVMIVMAGVCVCLLIYYIHHVATSIQADTLIAQVYEELEDRIDELQDNDQDCGEDLDEELSADSRIERLVSWRSGYITAIDCEGLLELAEKEECFLRLLKRPGHFVSRGEALVELRNRTDAGSEAVEIERIVPFVFINSKRTPEQDLEFLLSQLVEIALRALSPGINDPNTAVICIDYLSAALAQLAAKELPCRLFSENGVPKLYVPRTDFDGLLCAAFDQVRQEATSHAEIVIRIADGLGTIGQRAKANPNRRVAVSRQLDQLVAQLEAKQPSSPLDREDIQAAFRRCRDCL